MSISISQVLAFADAATSRALAALKGEPTRFIGYGAAVVVVGIVASANALGITRFGADVSLTDALVLTGMGITSVVTVIESIRRFVWPVASVEA